MILNTNLIATSISHRTFIYRGTIQAVINDDITGETGAYETPNCVRAQMLAQGKSTLVDVLAFEGGVYRVEDLLIARVAGDGG